MIQILFLKRKADFWWSEAEARVKPKARAEAKRYVSLEMDSLIFL